MGLKLAPHRTLLFVLAVMSGFHGPAHGDNLFQSYCSTENTGSSYDPLFTIYNSNGKCYDECVGNYAFAIVQYQDCWCSNYIPAEQSSASECNSACPGFPADLCGNKDEGLYGYIQLTISPSGTAGSSSAASTVLSSTTTSATPSTTYSTSTTSTSTTSSSTSVVAVAKTTQISTTSSTASQRTLTPSPVTSIQVVTLSGAVVTQTVTSTPVPYADPDTSLNKPSRKSVSSGTIAGAVVGSILGLALLLFGAFFLWRRRRRNNDMPRDPTDMKRNTSVLSKAGLLASARSTDAEKQFDEGAAAGTPSQRHSLFGADYEHDSPISPVGAVYETPLGTHDSRRNSRPMVYDQRLNPHAIMQNWELNGSRGSLGTLQDQRDYSRPLNVTNPDMHE